MAVNQPGQPSYFEKLIDRVKMKATARGAAKPTWNDVWTSMTEISQLAEVLGSRGVSTGNLATEIDYITHFKSGGVKVGAEYSDEEIQAAIAEIKADLQAYEVVANDPDEYETKQNARQVQNYLLQKISAFDLSEDPHMDIGEKIEKKQREIELKQRIYDETVEKSLKGVFSSIMAGVMGGAGIGGPSISEMRDLKKILMQGVISEFLYDQVRYGLQDEDEDVIAKLTALQPHPQIVPSAVDVTDFIIEESGYMYENLLFRNGLRTSNAELEDNLDGQLPSYTTQRTALTALGCAYDVNAKELTNRHLTLALLNSVDVQVHLHKLGISDLMKFVDDFRKHSVGMDDKPKGRISVHPRVSKEMEERLEEMDQVFKDTGRVEEVLLWLMKSDPALDKAINKAGLLRRMKSSWRKEYDKKLEDKDKVADEEKKVGFKITDQELDQLIKEFCVDWTDKARRKKFDPMIGDEDLVDQLTTKLLKRGKKNPVIIGEPGTGKTKALEGLSNAIVSGNVPKEMIGARLLMLDLNQMDDSPYKGVFESRVLPILKGVAERNASGERPPILLGIDELAVAQNAGTHSGDPNGFRGMIKTYLTDGDIFLLSTTTEEEYRTQVEKDAAFARRMQPVYKETPNDETTAKILVGLKRKYSSHHKLRIPDALMKEVATLSGRYIHTVNQPDKSIDVLDEACAIARKAGDATLKREHVLQAVSEKTHIPISFLSQDDNRRYADLEENLAKRVLGQDDAIDIVSAALKRAKAGFKDEHAPVGNFLFVGPTGVGKTELSKALAEFLMGDEDEFMVRFDMSEFAEKQAVSRFIGAPPGYVGYEEGGGLVTAVRSKPFAVYLYDEVEKAHPDVFNTLLAPLSDGVVTDGRGMKGDMRNTVNIMTSNLGAEDVMREGERLGLDPVTDYEEWQRMAQPIYERAVHRFFRPEFINRLDGIIYFNSLSPEVIQKLVNGRVKQTTAQLKENYGLELNLSDAFKSAAADKGFDVRYGARPLKRAWQDVVEKPLADWILRQDKRALKKAASVDMDLSREEQAQIALDERIDQLMEQNKGADIQQIVRQAQEETESPAARVSIKLCP